MFQKMIIVGNVGNDAESRDFNGNTVANFSVAVNRRWNDKTTGEQVEETTWFRVSAWGRLGEVCAQYVHKGMRVLVEGELKPDPATGGPRVYMRQDGTAGAAFELTAREVRFLSAREEGGGEGGNSQPRPTQSRMKVEEDDVPF